MDQIDKKILFQLDIDARKSFSEIGKELGIGKNNVQYRVNNLIREGIIKKFVVQPSLSRLNLFLGKIFFQLSGFTAKQEEDLYRYLVDNKKISWIAKTEGRWDLMIGMYVNGINQFAEVKKEVLNKIERYVTSYDVVFLAEGHTSRRNYLINKTNSKTIDKFMGKEGGIELKQRELDILKFISNNARFNYTDIANKFNINIKTARNFVSNLEKREIIQGYVTFLDTKKMGYSQFKLCIYLKNYQTELNKFIDYCLNIPNVVHVIESVGPWEIELEIESETLEEFYKITHEIRNDFSSIIKKTESVIISDEKKLDFLPAWV